MRLNYIVFFMMLVVSNSVYCQEQNENKYPSYSTAEKMNSIHKMRDLASKSQQETINSGSNYNRAMFDVIQKGYGGYSDINVEFHDKHTGLSSAEKKSIENTRRNVEIMKEQLKGLK